MFKFFLKTNSLIQKKERLLTISVIIILYLLFLISSGTWTSSGLMLKTITIFFFVFSTPKVGISSVLTV